MADNNPLKGYYLVKCEFVRSYLIFADSKEDAINMQMHDISALEHWASFYHSKVMIVNIEKYKNKQLTEEDFFSYFIKDEKAYKKIYQKVCDITVPLEDLTVWSK
jgi:hypothetical protein